MWWILWFLRFWCDLIYFVCLWFDIWWFLVSVILVCCLVCCFWVVWEFGICVWLFGCYLNSFLIWVLNFGFGFALTFDCLVFAFRVWCFVLFGCLELFGGLMARFWFLGLCVGIGRYCFAVLFRAIFWDFGFGILVWFAIVCLVGCSLMFAFFALRFVVS